MSKIRRKIREWYERQDEYEKSAITAFGIGVPFILVIFTATLFLLKLLHKW